MKQKLLLFTLSFISLHGVHGQNMIPADIPTPNATELARISDVPISYHTGKADISIPIHELTLDGVTVPITLQYDATGVLLNSLPGWTGHNWTLNAGGCIARVTEGLPDEFVIPNDFPITNRTTNYFHAYNKLPLYLQNTSNNYASLRNSVYNAEWDLSPDIFYFNFMGHTGRFFLGNDGQWKIYSEENLEVVFDIDDESNYIEPFMENYMDIGVSDMNYTQPKTIKGFLIRDSEGNQYYFGGSTDCIEYSMRPKTQWYRIHDLSWTANCWYLKSVKNRHGVTLFTFTYERGKFIAQIYREGHKTNIINTINNGYQEIENSNFVCPYDMVLNAPIYLKRIQATDGRDVVFESEDTGTPMSTIYPSIYSENQNNIRTFLGHMEELGYNVFLGYLHSNNTFFEPYQYNFHSNDKSDPFNSTTLRKLNNIIADGIKYEFIYANSSRMYLTGLNILNYNDTQVCSYSFRYDNFENLPTDYLTTKVDHWGYYNGKTAFLPDNPSDYAYYNNRRNALLYYAKRGMLTDIIYPTGGCRSFVYELNKYSKYMSADRQTLINGTGSGGGLRIKSITDYEDESKSKILKQRTFRYQSPNSSASSGELFAMPCYYWSQWRPVCADAGASTELSQFRTSSILPLSNSFGPYVGYSCVDEVFEDGTFTRYTYSNISSSIDSRFILDFNQGTLSPFDRFTERGYKRGKLQSVELYENNVLRKRTEYVYRVDNVESNNVLTCNLETRNSFDVINYGFIPLALDFVYYTGGVYKLFYPKYDVVEESTTIYDVNPKTVIKTYNRSDRTLTAQHNGFTNHVDVRILNSIVTEDGNDELEIYNQYPFDSQITCEVQLSTKQFYLLPNKVSSYKNNTLLSCHRTTYGLMYGNLIVPFYETEQKSSSTIDTLVTYLSYTPLGLLTKYQEMGMPPTTLVWDRTSHHILAKSVGYENLPTNLNYYVQQELISLFNNYRNSMNSQITSYTYDCYFHVTSITNALGYTTYYYYDLMGRLSEIRDSEGKLIKKIEYNYKH